MHVAYNIDRQLPTDSAVTVSIDKFTTKSIPRTIVAAPVDSNADEQKWQNN